MILHLRRILDGWNFLDSLHHLCWSHRINSISCHLSGIEQAGRVAPWSFQWCSLSSSAHHDCSTCSCWGGSCRSLCTFRSTRSILCLELLLCSANGSSHSFWQGLSIEWRYMLRSMRACISRILNSLAGIWPAVHILPKPLNLDRNSRVSGIVGCCQWDQGS